MNMRTFTFKGLFLTVLFMLLGSTAILAADDGLNIVKYSDGSVKKVVVQ
jgi:hypothetical protein